MAVTTAPEAAGSGDGLQARDANAPMTNTLAAATVPAAVIIIGRARP